MQKLAVIVTAEQSIHNDRYIDIIRDRIEWVGENKNAIENGHDRKGQSQPLYLNSLHRVFLRKNASP